jgi:arylsulfatase A
MVVLFPILIATLLLTGLELADGTAAEQDTARPPNVVVLLADNLGYEDVSWFATRKHKNTPNIDSLGEKGMAFHNWNSVAHLCSASRAALLTGQYPARTNVYPGVFHPDAVLGMTTPTLASHLKEQARYATAMVGKWHLGHRSAYLPTNHGFESWLGIPYHMSGGSIENHTCVFDENRLQWLPLYRDEQIVEQPVQTKRLAERYAKAGIEFIDRSRHTGQPFFLYMAFSHVHQLCASADHSEQETCQWAATVNPNFEDAIQEMDWIVGQILQAIVPISNNTLVVFTSDNGPWVAEQSCAGLKGPFQGQWCVR